MTTETAQAGKDKKSAWRRTIVVAAGGTIAFVVCYAWLVIRETTAVAEAASRAERRVVWVSGGLQDFEYQVLKLPPAYVKDLQGHPGYSWRGMLRGYLTGRPIFDRIDEPAHWQDEGLEQWRKTAEIHFCPAETKYDWQGKVYSDSQATDIVAVVGPGTAFDAGVATGDLPCSVVLILWNPRHDGHWLEPRDLDVGDVPTGKGLTVADFFGGPTIVCFADWQIWTLDGRTPLDSLGKFLTIGGAELADRENELGPFVTHRRGSRLESPQPLPANLRCREADTAPTRVAAQ